MILLGSLFNTGLAPNPLNGLSAIISQLAADLSSSIVSNILQIQGLVAVFDVTISGDGSPEWQSASDSEFSSIVQDWTSDPGTILTNQYIRVRLTSADSHNVLRTAVLSVGVTSAQFQVRTLVADQFSITSLTDQELAIAASSSGIQITANGTGDLLVSVSGDGSPEWQSASDSEFSSVVQDWTSSSGVIAPNNYIRVRLTSDGNHLSERSCTLNVGGKSDDLSVTTRAAIDVYLTTPGSGSWEVPAGWYSGNNYVELIGGGGSGAGAGPNNPGAGGGAGGYCRKDNLSLTPESSVDYVVGAGAAASAGGLGLTVGTAGGTTSFNSDDFRATGGAGGNTSPGAGGTGQDGDVNYAGGTGGARNTVVAGNTVYTGGGGGHAARPSGNGANGNQGTTAGGAGGNPNGGAGATAAPVSAVAGGSTSDNEGLLNTGGGGGGGLGLSPAGLRLSGANGGLYGGGSGGGGCSNTAGNPSGAGAQGVIHLHY